MSKLLAICFLTSCFLGLTLQPVLAMNIVVQTDGTTYFYDTRVLGDSDEKKPEEKSEEKSHSDNQSSGRSGHQETENHSNPEIKVTEQPHPDQSQPTQPRQTEVKPKPEPEARAVHSKPMKIVPKTGQTQIRLKTDREKTEVIIEKKRPEVSKDSTDKVEPKFSTQESIDTQELKLDVPSAHRQPAGENELKTDQSKKSLEERQKRTEEKVQIQTEPQADGTVEFQFESRNIKAKLQGAEVVVDPTTNAISITTPEGQNHTLVHLPDQALEQMQQAGSIDPTSSEFLAGQVELKTRADGTVTYEIQQQKHKKIFGFIPRTVDTTVELNDETGEVTETPTTSGNLFTRLLDKLAK